MRFRVKLFAEEVDPHHSGFNKEWNWFLFQQAAAEKVRKELCDIL
jgi:hypothetical protein